MNFLKIIKLKNPILNNNQNLFYKLKLMKIMNPNFVIQMKKLSKNGKKTIFSIEARKIKNLSKNNEISLNNIQFIKEAIAVIY